MRDQTKIWWYSASIVLNLVVIIISVFMGIYNLYWGLAMLLILELCFNIMQRAILINILQHNHAHLSEYQVPVASIVLNLIVVFIAMIMGWKMMTWGLVIIIILQLVFDVVQRIIAICYFYRNKKKNIDKN